jgi:integrase
VREGAWHDHSRGVVTFAEYVETVWLPSKHVETSTLAAYRSYLDKHFIPTLGRRPTGKILPSEVQRWVTTATEHGLSAASVRKYQTMLQSVFERALVDRVVTFNPCAHTELPKVIKKKARTLTPDEYDAILAALPAHHRLMVETAINTGLRWGELIALRPRHLHLATRGAHRRGDHRRGLGQELPHRPPDAPQGLPQRQRTPLHGPPTRPGHPAHRAHRRPPTQAR